MKRQLRHRFGLTLALLAITAASGGCYAGYGGHTGYGGYTKASGRTSGYSGYGGCRVSGGAEEFVLFAIFYGGIVVVAGVVELVEWIGDNCG